MNEAAAAILREPKLARLLAALAATGRETRIVGGAVRDALLGLVPFEIDLATAATPPAVTQAAENAGFKVAPTGLAHGTVTVVVEGAPFEVTTLREDVETFGRAAKVRFGADFEQDALRRDFTVNALSLGVDGTLYDYTGGREDLARRKIRFIGDSATRIAEDHLRILRFFRFSASIGDGEIDPAGFRAAIEARDKLALLSRERVRAELLKLLAAPRAAPTLGAMSRAGIFAALAIFAQPARLARLVAVEAALGAAPDPVLRLAAATVSLREDAERLREALRLSNAEYGRLALAAGRLETLHGREADFTRQELNELLFLLGRRGALDTLTLLWADSRAEPADGAWRAAARFLETAPAPAFPVRAEDLLRRGLAPGRELGLTLKRLQAAWIRAGFPDEPRRIIQLVEEATQSRDPPK